jgi:hypothetical protein
MSWTRVTGSCGDDPSPCSPIRYQSHSSRPTWELECYVLASDCCPVSPVHRCSKEDCVAINDPPARRLLPRRRPCPRARNCVLGGQSKPHRRVSARQSPAIPTILSYLGTINHRSDDHLGFGYRCSCASATVSTGQHGRERHHGPFDRWTKRRECSTRGIIKRPISPGY